MQSQQVRTHEDAADDETEAELGYGTLARCGRVARIVGFALLPIILLAGFGLAAIFVRLKHGEMSVSFLVPPIERGINAELTDRRKIEIGDAVLTLSDDGDLELRLKSLSLTEADGAPVATAPLAAVEISGLGLLSARIVPSRIELVKPRIAVVYSDGGQVALTIDRVPEASEGAGVPAGSNADPAPAPAPAVATASNAPAPPSTVDVAGLFRAMSERARYRVGATSYLTEIGARDAVLALEHNGARSELSIQSFGIGLDQTDGRSAMSARARIAGNTGSWTAKISAEESKGSDRVAVKAEIRDLVPSMLGTTIPPLAVLEKFDMPVAIDATFELAADGTLVASTAKVDVGSGLLRTGAAPSDGLAISRGSIDVGYDALARRVTLNPSPMFWGENSIVFAGVVAAEGSASADGKSVWSYNIEGRDGKFVSPDAARQAVRVDTWKAEGRFVPSEASVVLNEFHLAAGGGDVRFTGAANSEPAGWSVKLDGTIGPAALPAVRALWPAPVAPGARAWVDERVSAGSITSGTVKLATGRHVEGAPDTEPMRDRERISVALEVADMTFVAVAGVSPITAERALIRVENDTFELAMPEGRIEVDGKSVAVKGGRMIASALSSSRPPAEIDFTVDGALVPAVAIIRQLPVAKSGGDAPLPDGADGKFTADAKIKLPLISNVRLADVSVEGKGKIADGRLGKVANEYDVQGVSLDLAFTEQSLEVRGDVLINGVAVKVSTDRVFQFPESAQPPLRLLARADEADRRQLGLGLDDFVKGTTGIELAIAKDQSGAPVIALKADLTDAELLLNPVSWRKAAGRRAQLETDIVADPGGGTVLKNFKVKGDDVGIQGVLEIGANKKLRQFNFDTFNLDLVSRLTVQGSVGAGGLWNVKARGPNFDGRNFFRSLFSVGGSADGGSDKGAAKPPIDLTVKVDNVMGFADLYVRDLDLELSARGGKLTRLLSSGRLDNGGRIEAALDPQTRKLFVESNDAGQVMRLIDFYPNMQGGKVQLQVDLDGRGAAEKTGMLAVNSFRILGDEVVSEVVASADSGQRASRGGSTGQSGRVTRQYFDFDTMRVPFSVGHGQFVLSDSFLRGPVVGATIRGKVDFRQRRVNVGGTYIPLQGLNNALGGIPLIGQILSGTRSEGIFGITFAVQGALDNPEVLVNPLSLVAPGIFREMFQMTAPDPRVQARDDKTGGRSSEQPQRGRASSAPATLSGDADARTTSDIIDGWTSQTTQPSRRQ